MSRMSDNRIDEYKQLISPELLASQIQLSDESISTIKKARIESCNIIHGLDDRLLVIVGPCSIHDPISAIDYATRLYSIAKELEKDVCIIMRTYFEKPRTTIGWKGLINDPLMDGSFEINKGLEIARGLLCDITRLGVPVAVELLDTISPQFISDCISWGAIGARTTESQIHRELASGLSFPVGFKNGTSGNIEIAIDAIKSSSNPHHFLGVTKDGVAAITKTSGNNSTHIILRGSKNGTNFDKKSVSSVEKLLECSGLGKRIMIDCSHGNSCKDYTKQINVVDDVCIQLSNGNKSIIGVMIESNINSGTQKIPQDLKSARLLSIDFLKDLKYGTSITDGCVDWDTTVVMLKKLAIAVQERRKK